MPRTPPPTHRGLFASTSAHAPSGSSNWSHPTHSPDIGSQNGAAASVQSSFPMHGTGPVLLPLSLPPLSSEPIAVPSETGAVVESPTSPVDDESPASAGLASPTQAHARRWAAVVSRLTARPLPPRLTLGPHRGEHHHRCRPAGLRRSTVPRSRSKQGASPDESHLHLRSRTMARCR